VRTLDAALGLGRVGAEDVDVERGQRAVELRDPGGLLGLGGRYAEDAGFVVL
jgi:hypothetical protein